MTKQISRLKPMTKKKMKQNENTHKQRKQKLFNANCKQRKRNIFPKVAEHGKILHTLYSSSYHEKSIFLKKKKTKQIQAQ